MKSLTTNTEVWNAAIEVGKKYEETKHTKYFKLFWVLRNATISNFMPDELEIQVNDLTQAEYEEISKTAQEFGFTLRRE